MKDNVKVFLANMGPIPQHKPRADFSTGFFEVGAFEVIKMTAMKLRLMLRRLLVKVVLMLSLSVPQMIHIQNLVPPLAKRVERNYAECNGYLGRAPPKDLEPVYREAGVDDFISRSLQIVTKS